MTSLKYGISFLLVLLPGILLSAFAQQAEGKYIINVPEQMSEEQLAAFRKKIPLDGWVLLKYKEGDNLINLSNKDYELNFRLTCTDGTQLPGYLVEYSDAYGDGDYGGIDFISSRRDEGNEIHFLLNGKDYGDPFRAPGNPEFRSFAAALKRSSLLTISVYDFQFNPETGKDELRLNRSLDFKLAHSELLDMPVRCYE